MLIVGMFEVVGVSGKNEYKFRNFVALYKKSRGFKRTSHQKLTSEF
jgi:hypothetical protein